MAIIGSMLKSHGDDVTRYDGLIDGEMFYFEGGRLAAFHDVLFTVGPVGSQVRLQITVGHQLHDDQSGLGFGNHAQQLHHVMRIKLP